MKLTALILAALGLMASSAHATQVKLDPQKSPLMINWNTVFQQGCDLKAAHVRTPIEARVLRAGARTVFCEGDVLDSAGQAVCTARAVFKLIAL